MCLDKDVYRKLILRFYWDGEENPSVETPFGDFFGVGFSEYAQNTSLIQGVTSGGFYSYWPMPFTRGHDSRHGISEKSTSPTSTSASRYTRPRSTRACPGSTPSGGGRIPRRSGRTTQS
jgi:hypothetical protein